VIHFNTQQLMGEFIPPFLLGNTELTYCAGARSGIQIDYLGCLTGSSAPCQWTVFAMG
jgi:hypothetical protein